MGKHEFWNLAKADGGAAQIDLLAEILFLNFEVLRILSTLLSSYCPDTASKMLSTLDAPPSSIKFDLEKHIDVMALADRLGDKTRPRPFIAKVENQ